MRDKANIDVDALLAQARGTVLPSDVQIPTAEMLVSYVEGELSEEDARVVRSAILCNPDVLDEVTRLCKAFDVPWLGVGTELVLETNTLTEIGRRQRGEGMLALAAAVDTQPSVESEVWETGNLDVTLRVVNGRCVVHSVWADERGPAANSEIIIERASRSEETLQVAAGRTNTNGMFDAGEIDVLPPLAEEEWYQLRITLPSHR